VREFIQALGVFLFTSETLLNKRGSSSMLNTNSQPHSRRYLSSLCGLAFVLVSVFFFPGQTLAHSTTTPSFASPESFSVDVGFDGRYRDNSWIPVHISLTNDGADFNGAVSLNVPTSNGLNDFSAPSTYQAMVSLPSGSHKDLTLYMPLLVGLPGNTSTITASLLDANGHTISSHVSKPYSLNTDDILIGTLSDQDLPLASMNSLPLSDPTAKIYNYHLSAATFPSVANVLNNFDAILLDNFTTSTLSSVQLTALQNWVSRGGNLIVVGGPEWRRTLSPLPAKLLPVTPEGSDLLPAHSSILPLGGPSFVGPQTKKSEDTTLSSMLPISTGTVNAEAITVLSSDMAPLIVESSVGQGQVCYLAFDPTLSPLVHWSNISTLWKGILIRTLGDKMLMTNINSGIISTWHAPAYTYGGMSSLLQALFPTSILSPWVLFVLLLSYILLLGPVRFVLVRTLKNRDWSWRIILCTIVIFSGLSYALTIRQKGSSIISSSVSVIQLGHGDANKTPGHATTYVDVFVPNQGSFQVHMPGYSLVQPDSDPDSPTSSPTVIRSGQGGIDVNLAGVDSWTSHALISQHDLQISGSLLSNLLLQNNILQGTVTNMLPYALSDVYVLYDNHPIALGHLASHQMQQLSFPLSDDSGNNQNVSIADQIATMKNIQTSYNQPTPSHSPQNDLQRRIMTLQALSGENCTSFCNELTTNRQYYALKHSYTTSDLLNTPDPLLLQGAAATLIGWADPNPEMMGNITINGNASTGTQEALLQAPLDINYHGTIPAGTMMTQGQLINIQQPKDATIQTLMADIYIMSTGSMTFEFMLPNLPNLYANQISILEPQNLANILASAGGSLALTQDGAYMHGYLYNWQTHSWDGFTLNQYHYTPVNTQAYIGPGGRVLVQLNNDNPAVGNTLVGTPSLDIQGIVTS
jgi:uncharacterized membrane protein YhaH (DUF805 family)